ncbi:ParB-like protein, partial [Burkholderia cenocepacia]
MPRLPIRFALAASLSTLFALAACGGDDVVAVARTDAQPPSGGTTTPAPTPPATTTPPPGKWKAARAGDLIDVTLGDLHPTQGAIGYDQIYYKLGRYELQPDKKFDDFCADEGLGGVASSGYTARSSLREPASYTCATTDAN